MSKTIAWGLTFLIAALAVRVAVAAPDGYTHILTKTEELEFEGHQVMVPFDIWVQPRFEEDAAYFDLWADADLTEIQGAAPDIMAESNSYDRCGDQVTVSNVTLVPAAPQAQLCANVHHERWQCLFAMIPVVNGFSITMQRQETARTVLVEQDARVCADLWTEIEEDGASVKLEGNVTQTSVSGNSGLLGILVDVRGQFRSRLRSEVNSALSNLRVIVPEALQPFDPVVETAEFTEREDGVLGLELTMTVAVTPEDVSTLLQMLLAGPEDEESEEQ